MYKPSIIPYNSTKKPSKSTQPPLVKTIPLKSTKILPHIIYSKVSPITSVQKMVVLPQLLPNTNHSSLQPLLINAMIKDMVPPPKNLLATLNQAY
jgi:hypothetical protein